MIVNHNMWDKRIVGIRLKQNSEWKIIYAARPDFFSEKNASRPVLGCYERDELTNSLLRHCELDTFAMVMIYEAMKELLKWSY